MSVHVAGSVMLQHYKGPLRREEDPAKAAEVGALWGTESNRSAVRLCVQKMSEYRKQLAPDQHNKLREVYQSVMRLETREDQDGDAPLGDAARSFGRYFSALISGESPDLEVLNEHIVVLYALTLGAEVDPAKRAALAASVVASVEARLATIAGSLADERTSTPIVG